MSEYKIPIGRFGEYAMDLVVEYLHPVFAAFELVATGFDSILVAGLSALPPLVLIILVSACAWRSGGKGLGAFALVSLGIVVNVGLWDALIQTLSMVLTATLLAVALGIPVGIMMAESAVVRRLIVPMLDFLQTMPRFVFLIPAVILLGIGSAAAIFATLTLAAPPAVRLTAVGIMEVDKRTVEAAEAFGSSPAQILIKVKLPLAFPSIVLGINQALMMSLNMVVIASLIGAQGLGEKILSGIALLRAGEGVVAGLGVFVLAILIDRITRGAARRLTRTRDAVGR